MGPEGSKNAKQLTVASGAVTYKWGIPVTQDNWRENISISLNSHEYSIMTLDETQDSQFLRGQEFHESD